MVRDKSTENNNNFDGELGREEEAVSRMWRDKHGVDEADGLESATGGCLQASCWREGEMLFDGPFHRQELLPYGSPSGQGIIFR